MGFTDAGWSSSVARWAHNPEVAGSNPAPATNRQRPSQSDCEGLSHVRNRLCAHRSATGASVLFAGDRLAVCAPCPTPTQRAPRWSPARCSRWRLGADSRGAPNQGVQDRMELVVAQARRPTGRTSDPIGPPRSGTRCRLTYARRSTTSLGEGPTTPPASRPSRAATSSISSGSQRSRLPAPGG